MLLIFHKVVTDQAYYFLHLLTRQTHVKSFYKEIRHKEQKHNMFHQKTKKNNEPTLINKFNLNKYFYKNIRKILSIFF